MRRLRNIHRPYSHATATPNPAYLFQSAASQSPNGPVQLFQVNTGPFAAFYPPTADRYLIGVVHNFQGVNLVGATWFGEPGIVIANVVSTGIGIGMFIVHDPRAAWPTTLASQQFGRGWLKWDGSVTAAYSGALYGVTGLASPVPRSVASSVHATDVARSVDLDTAPGGFIIAASANDITASNSCTWTGDQSPTENYDNAASITQRISGARIFSTNDDTANTITSTYAQAATVAHALLAASFR